MMDHSAEAAEKIEIMLSGKTDRIDEVLPWADQRSAVDQADRLNANDTAVTSRGRGAKRPRA